MSDNNDSNNSNPGQDESIKSDLSSIGVDITETNPDNIPSKDIKARIELDPLPKLKFSQPLYAEFTLSPKMQIRILVGIFVCSIIVFCFMIYLLTQTSGEKISSSTGLVVSFIIGSVAGYVLYKKYKQRRLTKQQ
jgi:hypothetical protein